MTKFSAQKSSKAKNVLMFTGYDPNFMKDAFNSIEHNNNIVESSDVISFGSITDSVSNDDSSIVSDIGSCVRSNDFSSDEECQPKNQLGTFKLLKRPTAIARNPDKPLIIRRP